MKLAVRPPDPLVLLAGCALAGLALTDVATFNPRTTSGRLLLVAAVLVALLCWLVRRQAAAGRLARALGLGVLAAIGSTAVTHVVANSVLQRTPGLLELSALLLVLLFFARWLRYWQLALGALPVLVAVVLLPRRLAPAVSLPLLDDLDVWFGMLPVVFVAAGLHLRSLDARRRADEERIRRAERLELARDLHDDVAHFITAMVVQAQAGEAVVADHQGRELFGNIERTGQEGLVAMGRMVRLLREGDPDRPAAVGDIDTVRRQVERFTPPATLEVAGGVNVGAWSPELAKSVERLVREGLTNVRKHARSATAVQVLIEPDGDRLVVRVRDDGSRAGRTRFRPSGFGVLGLAERVSALGGELTSGPLVDGGWQLRASIPVR